MYCISTSKPNPWVVLVAGSCCSPHLEGHGFIIPAIHKIIQIYVHYKIQANLSIITMLLLNDKTPGSPMCLLKGMNAIPLLLYVWGRFQPLLGEISCVCRQNMFYSSHYCARSFFSLPAGKFLVYH